jgi:hypothetical protein
MMFIADATGGTDSGLIGGLIGAVGSVGFAIWYGWHVTTKTIPSIVNDFREERKYDRTERETDRKDREAERHEFTAALSGLTAAVKSIPCQDARRQ